MVANIDGVILQYVADPDVARSRRDLAVVTEMLVDLTGRRRELTRPGRGHGDSYEPSRRSSTV